MDLHKAVALVLLMAALLPLSFAGACYSRLDADAQGLRAAETNYISDSGAYTCNAAAMGWSPANTNLAEWTCNYATDSAFNWTYSNGTSSADVTEVRKEVAAEQCPVNPMSPGCTSFAAQVRSMQTAEATYYTDWETYSCSIASYWIDPIPDGWVCDAADGAGYGWTFTSQLGEAFSVDETTSVDCSQDLYCNTTGFGGATTNVSAIIRTRNFSGITVERVGLGKIYWPGPVNVSGYDLVDYVAIGSNFVGVNTAAMPNLDMPANVSIYNLAYVARPVLYRNGAVCPEGACTFLGYSGGTYTFQVTGFSNYTAGPNARLEIFDDNDALGGNKNKAAGDNVYFYANYSNITSGAPITDAIGGCGISFSEAPAGPFAMAYNSSSGLWEYNRTFASDPLGWSVNCSGTGYEPLGTSDFFSSFTSGMIELYGANVTVGSTGRYFSPIGAGNITTEGGNVTGADLSANESTDRWAGFYGNITGAIVLAQSADTQMVYMWPWNSSDGGAVCASTANSMGIINVSGAGGGDIDSAWSFPSSATDSGANTFNNTNCSVKFGPTTISGADYADTGYAGGFVTCAYKTVSSPAKNQMLFCANITYNGQLFNNETGDYEMMVPTAYGAGVYETYYFYLNLD